MTVFQVQWIASEGGPLLLLSADLLPHWEGIAPPTAGRVVVATFRALGPQAPATDYDRACDVTDALGLIDVGPGRGLVLGEEPAQTAWWPLAGGGGPLVRWHHAESAEAVSAALRTVPPTAFGPPTCVLPVSTPPLVVFDAALPGSEVLRGEHLRLALPAGAYTVATADHRPDRATSLTVHRLLPRSATDGSATSTSPDDVRGGAHPPPHGVGG